jgi:hypothetical protein
VRRTTGPDLIFRAPRVGGGVQKTAAEIDAAQPTLTHQIVKRILHVDVEPVGEFVGEPALRRPGATIQKTDSCRAPMAMRMAISRLRRTTS